MRWFVAVAAALAAIGMFWLGGYDFNERGPVAVFTALFALWFGAVGFIVAHFWEKDE